MTAAVMGHRGWDQCFLLPLLDLGAEATALLLSWDPGSQQHINNLAKGEPAGDSGPMGLGSS